jgi:hypothetical protein
MVEMVVEVGGDEDREAGEGGEEVVGEVIGERRGRGRER